MPSQYRQHVAKWSSCTACDLCNRRKNTVLLRGSVPAKVLLVGEAPGESEDIIGRPFVGPAGKLLDRIIENAGLYPGDYAITNLIACIPRDETYRKVHEPPNWAIEDCRPRLVECLELVRPKLVVFVGTHATKFGPAACREWGELTNTTNILHPAAILRMNVSQQGLAIQRSIVALQDAWEELK